MARNTGGKRGDVRQSALWGSGNRGGEFRSNALWGKGGRGLVTTVVAMPSRCRLRQAAACRARTVEPTSGGYVSSQLKQQGKTHPNDLVSVIVQKKAGVSAEDAKKAESVMAKLGKRFGLINGFAGEIRGQDLVKLEQIAGLTVTLDAPVDEGRSRPALCSRLTTSPTSTQLWTHETGVNKLWGGPQAPTIAIVDSGIDKTHPSFGDGSRIVAAAGVRLEQQRLARRSWSRHVRGLDRGG